MERWAGCVALVTGGSVGIGAAMVRRLARDGLKVIACARHVDKIQMMEKELKESGVSGEVCPVRCDLRRESDIAYMFRLIRSKYGRLDVCINNAGVLRMNSLTNGNVEEWREMFDVNVLALCICTKEAIKLMRECGVNDGHIIHINSIAGHRVPMNEASFYAATKHAVTALTEGLRRELAEAESQIRVSSISPGLVDTAILQQSVDRMSTGNSHHHLSQSALKVDDVVEAMVYILSARPCVQVHDIQIRHTQQRH